jgi:hypothetical protein
MFNKAVFSKPNKPKIFKKETIIFVRRPRRIINTAIDRAHHHAVAPVDRSNTMPVDALSFNQSDSLDFDIIKFVVVGDICLLSWWCRGGRAGSTLSRTRKIQNFGLQDRVNSKAFNDFCVLLTNTKQCNS